MSIMEEQDREQQEHPAVAPLGLHVSNAGSFVRDDAGFDFEADLATGPDFEVGIPVHVRSKSTGRPQYYVRDGQTLPVTVTVLSKHSSVAQKVDKELRRKRIRGAVKREDLYQEQLYKLARCTTGWEGFVGKDLKPLPFRWQDVEKLYRGNSYVRIDALEVLEEGEAEDFSEAS